MGNLALVEEPINISLGNKGFAEKREVYPRSKFLLTKLVAERATVGANTAVERATEGIEPFQEWTSSSIQERQEVLTKLTHQVCQMSTATEDREQGGRE